MIASAQVRFGRITSQEVIGQLKSTGSKDPDVLFAAKERLMETVKPLNLIGIWAYVCGVLCCLLIILAFIGVPLLGFGWWVRKRGAQNIATVEAAFAEYMSSLGASPRAA